MGYPTLTYDGNSVVLPFPSSCTTEIMLPFDRSIMDDDTISIYDHGEQYDKRICKCKFELSASKQEDLNTLLNSTARAKTLTLSLTSGDGFFPFGPDKGDAGSFSVSVVLSGTPRILDYPFRYFECELIITNVGSYPAYSLPSQISDGKFRIGTIDDLRMPQTLFNPDQKYTISVAHTENSTPQYFDRGSLGDGASVKFVQECNETKAAALLYYLTHTIRSNSFTVQSELYYYIFGADHGSDSMHYVQQNSDRITVEHINYNNYKLHFDFKKVAAP